MPGLAGRIHAPVLRVLGGLDVPGNRVGVDAKWSAMILWRHESWTHNARPRSYCLSCSPYTTDSVVGVIAC